MADRGSYKIDPVLTNVSIAYQSDEYIAEQILPAVPTETEKGFYYVRDDSNRRPAQSLRAPGSPSNEVDNDLTTERFYTQDHALKGDVPDEVRRQAPSQMNVLQDEAENVTERIQVGKEQALQAALKNNEDVSNKVLSGTDQWDDYDGSNPRGDFKEARMRIKSLTGVTPNTGVLGYKVFEELRDHPMVLDQFKYTSGESISADMLARFLNLDTLLIGGATVNTSTEGQLTANDYIWGNDAYLMYVAPTQRLKQITLGWTFRYNDRQVKRMYDEDAEKTWVRVSENYGQELAVPQAAYRFDNAVSN